jgi:PAS domain S-box-containing protein
VQNVEARTIYDTWWECRIVPLLEGELSPTAMIICNDVTQHRMAERWARIQHHLSVRLSETSDLSEALEASLNAALEVCEMDCCGIYLVDESGGIRLAAHRGVSSSFVEAAAYFDADSIHAQIVRAAEPVYASLDEVPAAIRDGCGREGMTSLALVPVCHESKAIACLNVASRSLDEFPQSVRTGLETTASHIGAAVARIQADQSRLKSEARFRLIAENVSDVVWTCQIADLHDFVTSMPAELTASDLDGLFERTTFTFFSPSVEQVLGYTVQEALRLRPRDFVTPASYGVLRNGLLDILVALRDDPQYVGGREMIETEQVMRDGRRLWCEMTAKLLRDSLGRVIGLEGVTRDVSERKNFERDLSGIVTREQQRMGQELHDELGQQLVGARLLAESLLQTLRSEERAGVERAGELVETLREAQSCVRELIKGVRPVEVDANGLMAALAELARSTERLSGISCSFTRNRPVPVEDNHTATQLFYIAREAVRNAVNHAKAGKIVIALAVDQGQLRLWVSDNGVGIDPHTGGTAAGMGLRIMRHRAGVIGAELFIDSAKDRGTRIVCNLPMEPRP